LTTISALMPLQYSKGVEEVIFASNTSLYGWGAYLDQIDAEGKRYSLRFLSRLWTDSKKRYDVGKREYRELLKGLRKV
jgi:RNase H-like domain found in reverse transcriptase